MYIKLMATPSIEVEDSGRTCDSHLKFKICMPQRAEFARVCQKAQKTHARDLCRTLENATRALGGAGVQVVPFAVMPPKLHS